MFSLSDTTREQQAERWHDVYMVVLESLLDRDLTSTEAHVRAMEIASAAYPRDR